MYKNTKSLNEECGVFGVYNNNDASRIAFFGLHSLQHRGQEGCGIVTNHNDKFNIVKGKGLLTEVIKEDMLEKLEGENAIGHVRYATSGGGGSENIQPFVFHQTRLKFSLCHNGNIVNSKEIKVMLENNGSIFQSQSDSELVAHLIMNNYKGDLVAALKTSLNFLEGAFSFLLLFENKLIAVRDKLGLRPLAVGKLNEGYVVSSETCGLDLVGAKFLYDVKPGEIIIFEDDKVEKTFYASATKSNMCAMEYIYFSRPDSVIEGINVNSYRYKTGELLAKQSDTKADVVIGVPDSSIAAAIGYASESGIDYRMGLLKNKYVGRTFIEPTQELREEKVKLKLSVIQDVVEGKDIILVDDSLVRGTTSKKLVRLLKDHGAKKVHVKIASPPIMFPCFYGVDISTLEELVAYNKSIAEICEYIEADSLEYLDINSLEMCSNNTNLCKACFNGVYPTHLYANLESANKEGKF
ncbi:MAG: amidophosphoribosyltransferase [Lachnospirales bacterium]